MQDAPSHPVGPRLPHPVQARRAEHPAPAALCPQQPEMGLPNIAHAFGFLKAHFAGKRKSAQEKKNQTQNDRQASDFKSAPDHRKKVNTALKSQVSFLVS